MEITVNGEPRTIERPCTVRALLVSTGFDRAPCAVEVNRDLVPHAKHDEHELTDGDVVEIVTLVGGG